MLRSGVRIWFRPGSALAAVALVLALEAAGQDKRFIQPQKLAPYVSSPQPIVYKMLEIARLKSGETLYDLGCGDGRILTTAAREFGAKAIGVELSPALVKRARQAVESLGLQDQVKVIEGDLMNVDLSGADVVALYLLTEANEQLRPKLEKELKPGARVVSLEFRIKGWKPSRVEKVEAHRHPYTIYLYELPQK
ncbi:MAG: class I SAM-dependent methyltransferase [Bryobacteraceae bacterium]|nr:class I SAM-dependent methyltransferase [Bryobacteraceae bacterium]MCX7603500.1 class I SAM-dependent methyltransferase [Bryobacteraceae bacterium]